MPLWDDAEVFQIKDQRHVSYWMDQAYPVLLVVRDSAGEVRWMEVHDWLREATDGATTTCCATAGQFANL